MNLAEVQGAAAYHAVAVSPCEAPRGILAFTRIGAVDGGSGAPGSSPRR